MTHNYLAFLRGINVGGKAIIKMADLRQALEADGFADVSTYIQSGNVLFSSSSSNKKALARQLQAVLAKQFDLQVAVALFTKNEWSKIIADAPAWWGKEADWKHNILIITEPITSKQVLEAMGVPKPDIEFFAAGKGVVYQSVLFKAFGRSTTGKLAANPVYKMMTIRNYNTATKLAV